MKKYIAVFSLMLINIFNLISYSGCVGFFGEPDYPEDLLK